MLMTKSRKYPGKPLTIRFYRSILEVIFGKGVDYMLVLTLRAARVRRGLRIREVAGATGRSIDTISRYERDSTDIPRSLMEQLLELYGVGADQVFFGPESDFTGRRP